MSNFSYVRERLFIESVDARKIVESFGTPVYVYSRAAIEHSWKAIHNVLATELPNLEPVIAYAVKANSHIAILNLLVRMGSAFDVVSEGELQRVLKAGGKPENIYFSGVGKTEAELVQAIQLSIACIHVESEEELARVNQLAKALGKWQVPIALRINPDVNPDTHPYIATGLKENKFGINLALAKKLYQQHAKYPHLKWVGLACHIGSQIFQQEPYIEALRSLVNLYDELAQTGLVLTHLDLGGGFGITYTNEKPFNLSQLAKNIREVVGNRPLKLMIEPGRAIVGNAGALLTRIEYLKSNEEKHFAIVDAGMNDLLRPALYQATHPIWPLEQAKKEALLKPYEIVGPICETGDFLAKKAMLPPLHSGDFLAIGVAGAYGFSMSSNYNTRPKAAEVMVDGDQVFLISPRQTVESLIQNETTLPF